MGVAPWASPRASASSIRRSTCRGTIARPSELPRPFDQAALFGREQPLEVEVGSGKGLFLAGGGASQSRSTIFWASKCRTKYARYAAARLARQASGKRA